MHLQPVSYRSLILTNIPIFGQNGKIIFVDTVLQFNVFHFQKTLLKIVQ